MKRRFFPPRYAVPAKEKTNSAIRRKIEALSRFGGFIHRNDCLGDVPCSPAHLCVHNQISYFEFPVYENAVANTTPVGSLRCSSHRACSCGICLCFHNAVFSFLHNNRDGEQVARFRFPQGDLRNLCARIRAFPFCE